VNSVVGLSLSKGAFFYSDFSSYQLFKKISVFWLVLV
jgi:hypothetical protein